MDELLAFFQQENSQLADCLTENKFLLNLAYLCDTFAKANKLNNDKQRSDKNVLDISNKIAAFMKKLSLWKEDIASMSANTIIDQTFVQTIKFLF